MTDFQKIMDSISDADRKMRSQYHMTLGELADICLDFNPIGCVVSDCGISPSLEVNSYRGYYCDLAIAPNTAGGELCLTRDLGVLLNLTIDKPLNGYKGGDFLMTKDTPLWLSDYSEYTGLAIMDAVANTDGNLCLKIKKIQNG